MTQTFDEKLAQTSAPLPKATKTFLLPTVRYDLMKKLVSSVDKLPDAQTWKWCVAFQCYEKQQRHEIESLLGDKLHYTVGYENRIPPYQTRALMYKKIRDDFDVFCSLDDDMQFVSGKTDFTKAVEKVGQPTVGVVSCNWVRFDTPKLWARSRWEETFLKQALVNMSGGMVYGRKVVDAVFDYPVKPYMFCDIQLALVSYLNGYDNFRYLGSTLIHSVMVKDGLRTMFAQRNMDIPESEFLSVEACKSEYKDTTNNWYMPESKNLTVLAHETHNKNRGKL